jgi:hypothetical protein
MRFVSRQEKALVILGSGLVAEKGNLCEQGLPRSFISRDAGAVVVIQTSAKKVRMRFFFKFRWQSPKELV